MKITKHAAFKGFAALFMASIGFCCPETAAAAPEQGWKFDFGPAPAAPGHISVTPDMIYSAERGYGFETGAEVKIVPNLGISANGLDGRRRDFATSDKPFLFSVAVPEGVYNVSLMFGGGDAGSTATVKAEARRLMLEKVRLKAGEFAARTFSVAVKRPQLKAGGVVGLKPDEQGHRDWDDRLTLEFNGERPSVSALEITPITNAVTVFIAGDSTVTDQKSEPWCGWGQMLPRFFKAGVAVGNHAESGESLRSSLSARRLAKILELIKPGDYLFIQFGHNDQKDKSPGAGPFTTYKANLKLYIAEARKKGALPVLITSMERRRFDGDKPLQTLADYAEAVRQTGQEENVPVIDLNAMSLKLYAALGPEKSRKAFVHYPANTFPGQTLALKDDTHFNAYGGYELAKCVVEGIKTQLPTLAKFLTDDAAPFDPSQPDDVEQWSLPSSPLGLTSKPEGN